MAELGPVIEEDLLPIPDTPVSDVLDLGCFRIAVEFPQGFSKVWVWHIAVAQLIDQCYSVISEAKTLHRITPDDRPFVAGLLLGRFDLGHSRGICGSHLGLK